MDEKRGFKGIWIPKHIWLDQGLTLQEKVFFAEIDSLDNESGCYATNTHFSEFFNLSKNRCSEVIKSLEKKGLILVNYIMGEGGKNIDKRVIRVFDKSNRGIRDVDRPIRKTEHPTRNIEQGYSENWEGNNTVYNNTVNNTINNTGLGKNEFLQQKPIEEKKPISVNSDKNPKKKSAKKRVFNKADFRAALLSRGANEQHVEDWIAVRDKRKAPYTKTALNAFLNECDKNDFPVCKAVEICASEGWRGFKAEWARNLNSNNEHGNTKARAKQGGGLEELARLSKAILHGDPNIANRGN